MIRPTSVLGWVLYGKRPNGTVTLPNTVARIGLCMSGGWREHGQTGDDEVSRLREGERQ